MEKSYTNETREGLLSVFLFRSEKFEAENFKFEPSEAFLSVILTQQ